MAGDFAIRNTPLLARLGSQQLPCATADYANQESNLTPSHA